MVNSDEFVKVMFSAAHEAGQLLKEYYERGNTNKGLETKASGEIVTQADRESNNIITSYLGRNCPGIPILTEENEDDISRLDSTDLFIIDPLDGTNNFVAGREDFAISIAYTMGESQTHQPVLGVVHHPLLKETYSAKYGNGASLFRQMDSIPLKVSYVKDWQRARLICSLLRHDSSTEQLKEKSPRWTGGGSAALMICQVAAGEADWYAHVASRRISEYDVCAADLILSEAGGCLTDSFGKKITYNKSNLELENGVLATNGWMHNSAKEITANIYG